MKDDPKIQAGYKWLNLNFLFRWAWGTVVWHDEITGEKSFAVKACISGKRIAENFGEQLRHRAFTIPRNGWNKLIARLSGDVMPTIQPPFYEGPETEAERNDCLEEAGRNQDGTLKDD